MFHVMQLKGKADEASKEAKAAYDDAYKTLSDKDARAKYDRANSHQASQATASS